MPKTFNAWIEAPNGVVIGYETLTAAGKLVRSRLAKKSRFHIRRIQDVDPVILQANEGEAAGFFPVVVGAATQHDPNVIAGDDIPVRPEDSTKEPDFSQAIVSAVKEFPKATAAALAAITP
jgi:hypothetical protein